MRCAVAAVLVAACPFEHGSEPMLVHDGAPTIDTPAIDAPPTDAPIDGDSTGTTRFVCELP